MLTKEEIDNKLSNQMSRLRYFRELTNVTIDKICHDTGINRNTYTLLERDPIKKHTIGHYMLLAEYYGTSLDYIIGNDVEPTHMVNYLTKRMRDEMEAKKVAFQSIAESLKDDDLAIDDVTWNVQNTLDISHERFLKLQKEMTSIPQHILIEHAKRAYPYNLLGDIVSPKALMVDFHITNNLMDDIDQLLDEYLSEREARILRLRYINGMTLQAIADMLSVTHERVRQLEAKAIRQLRHVVYTQKLLQSAQIRENQQKIDDQRRTITALERQIEHISNQIINKGYKPVSITGTIDELSLTNRAYNFFRLSGVETIEQVLQAILSDTTQNMKGLGTKSINNTLYRLHQAGYLESFPDDEAILGREKSLTNNISYTNYELSQVTKSEIEKSKDKIILTETIDGSQDEYTKTATDVASFIQSANKQMEENGYTIISSDTNGQGTHGYIIFVTLIFAKK